ncbi:MAG: mitochondrial fission ELM1 family protein [Kiritimatiellaeota bacterium]|nr:mitochondrial fission ELM1 family protein [Kiritimatiellota bacterium]
MRIWILSDGKAGHASQTRGLAGALLEGVKAGRTEGGEDDGIVEVDVSRHGLCAVWRAWRHLAAPTLILATGHRTHCPLLLAGLLMRKARTVVCMKPTLPMAWFDLCIVPRHDFKDAGKVPKNVIVTIGALNGIRPRPEAAKDRGLILIGGPSKEYGWDEDALLRQLARFVDGWADPAPTQEPPPAPTRWVLTTSRRTPPGLCERVPQGIEVVPVEQTPRGWVAEQLMHAHTAWVTRDSVSMIYESLGSGAAVGLLDVPLVHQGLGVRGQGLVSRVQRGIAMLEEDGRVTSFSEWERTGKLKTSEPLVETDRVASLIQERYCAE